MGARAYTKIKDIGPMNGVVIEIGSERGEGSTKFLSNFCLKNNLDFYSIDFEKEAYDRASIIEGVKAYNTTGEIFLRVIFPKFNHMISFAYLDGFDFILPGMREQIVRNQRKVYSSYGFNLSNNNSMKSHLLISELILQYASDKCYIIIDDTWFNGKNYKGKGGLAVPFLLENDFKIIECGTNKNIFNSYVFLGKK